MSKQIEEVMALVDSYVKASIEYAIHLDDVPLYDESMDLAREQLDKKRSAIESKLRELLPGWEPIDTAPVKRDVLAVNSLGYIGRAYQDSSGRWNHIGKPIGWMPLPKAPE